VGAAVSQPALLLPTRRSDAGTLPPRGDCLYGRYWGSVEHQPCLHFEVCYYQAIDYAIAHGLGRVEAGAQGEHKLARGYLPATTYSAHYIADPGFRRAVARYLEQEREEVAETVAVLTEYGPYRKGVASSE
jgi:predicted N-acyltransferase